MESIDLGKKAECSSQKPLEKDLTKLTVLVSITQQQMESFSKKENESLESGE